METVKIDRSQVVALSFVFLSLGSAIYVSLATVNYLELYPVLSQIGTEQLFQVDKLQFVPSGSTNTSVLTILISVTNPSSYSGLRLGDVAVIISFYVQTNYNITLFDSPNRLNATQSNGSSLAPNSSDHVSVPVPLTSEQSKQLAALNMNYPGQVIGTVQLRVDVVTFLVSATGTVPFTRTQDVLLSSN